VAEDGRVGEEMLSILGYWVSRMGMEESRQKGWCWEMHE